MQTTNKNICRIGLSQLNFTVFICMLVDIIINPKTIPLSFNASSLILSMAINLLFIALVSAVLHFIIKKNDFEKLLQTTARGKCILFLLFVGFAFQTGQAITTAENFYRFVSDNLLSVWLFVLIVLVVAGYASYLGIESIARSGVIVGVCLAASIIFIIVANTALFKLDNLIFAKQPFVETINSLISNFKFPTEIFVYAILSTRVSNKKHCSFNKLLAPMFCVFVLLIISQELVLGKFATLQIQPLHTLARIGSISVFTRLDAIHVSLWTMLSMFRIGVYIWCMQFCLDNLITKDEIKKHKTIICIITAVITTLVCINLKEYNINLMITMLMFFIAMLFIVLFIGDKQKYATD